MTSEMKTIKVNEATELQLDWLVATVEGHSVFFGEGNFRITEADYLIRFRPTINWSQGGPIIGREKISIRQWANVHIVHAYMPDGGWSSDGTSPLIAAMRCYCCSKLGDIVDVPEELCQSQKS